jgi:hypothetical protein
LHYDENCLAMKRCNSAYTADCNIVKTLMSFIPTFFTAGMIATEIPETISPYSIAAAPDSSFRKRSNWINMSVPLLVLSDPQVRSTTAMVNNKDRD